MANHYEIPKWAGKPPVGLHLDVLKGDKLIQKLMVDEKKCYLFGRNQQLNDFSIDHGSCSRVHAALVYHKHLDRVFLVDLGSVHGTYIGNMRLEANKPTQLPIDSTFHFGASTRNYIIRERPSIGTSAAIDELEKNTEDYEASDLLGLPESETELHNLTEYNTAMNKKISMLGITDDEIHQTRRRKKKNITFNDEEEIINPEDVDPSVGRFRNLVKSAVVSTKRRRIEDNVVPSHQVTRADLKYTQTAATTSQSHQDSSLYSFPVSSTFLTSSLGIRLPNPAPGVEQESNQASTDAPHEIEIHGSAEGQSNEPEKKKYIKEAWPGRKSLIS